jgi:uncharacterized membrane protein required for colicin V production
MAADGVFLLILLYSFILGGRRGIYKEVVQTLALIVAIVAAKIGREPVGATLAAKTGVPLMLAEVAAVVMVWISVFFVVAVVGRLLLKKIRGEGIDDELGEGAEQVADAIGGDTNRGPFTLLTDPFASKNGFFYWSDKILGCALGLLKGAVTGYLLFAVVIYADRARGWDSDFARQVESSYAARFFHDHVEGNFLNSIPEYRIAKSLDDMKAIGDHFEKDKDPQRFDAFVNDPRLRGIRDYPAVQTLTKDPAVKKAWETRDLKILLQNAAVRELLSDPELRKRLAAIEWEQLRKELEGKAKPEAATKTSAAKNSSAKTE